MKTSWSRILLCGLVAALAWVAGPVAGAAAQATITSAPALVSSDATPEFEFSGADGASFECQLRDVEPAFTPCTSPRQFDALPDGAYVFEVRELAPGDPTPDFHAFTVDTTAPDTTIDSGTESLSADNTPEFTFSSPETGTSFECSVHAPNVAADFSPCGSPHAAGPLADGVHVFEVRAVDGVGNTDPSPASRTVHIDTTAPQTDITGGPGDTTAATAVFLFSAAGAVRFSCRVDGGAWQPCGSPQVYEGLSLGPHRFEVTAVDEAGNEDPTPAHHAWQVLKPGLVIPAAVKQATALARELVQIKRALANVRLRTLARRRALVFRTFDALTAGTVEIRARARIRQAARRRWIPALAGRREVPGAGRHRVRAGVTRKARRLARRRAKLPLELRLSFTDIAGRSLRATSELTLKR